MECNRWFCKQAFRHHEDGPIPLVLKGFGDLEVTLVFLTLKDEQLGIEFNAAKGEWVL